MFFIPRFMKGGWAEFRTGGASQRPMWVLRYRWNGSLQAAWSNIRRTMILLRIGADAS